MRTSANFFSSKERAFTFIELVIVIALIAFAYVIAMPNFTAQSTTQVMDKLNRLGGDIRSAFDLAVLNHQAYRIVFELRTGSYWLETTEQESFYLGGGDKEKEKSQREGEGDLSEKREKEMREEFNVQFEKYTSLAGDSFKDPDTDVEIPPMSPVVRAKERLQKPIWTRVQNIEWTERSLAPQLRIKDMRAEHHLSAVTLEGKEEGQDIVQLYFLPGGYVERAYIHIYYMKGDVIDEAQQPWTIITYPYRGEATLISGNEQVDLANPPEEE